MANDIESVELYRGVGIHDCQPRERIETVVKPALDDVFAMSGSDELLAYCGDYTKPPEGRLLAGAKLEAALSMATASREGRRVDPDLVKARIAGLGSRRWRDPSAYGSLLDLGGGRQESRRRNTRQRWRQTSAGSRRRRGGDRLRRRTC
jgi:hypothetical protein